MPASERSGVDRRKLIAESGVRIIARDGVRALTHRAVDREAGIPQGSTSYYVPTRHALIDLIVSVLAERSIADAEQAASRLDTATHGERRLDAATLARQIAALIQTLSSRRDDMRARYALLLELEDDTALRARLTEKSDVHVKLRHSAASALAQAGVPDPKGRAEELFALTDSLVLQRLMLGAVRPIEPILAAYLRGILTGD
ncbi:TetR/AcrR family transcriptional regulator [Luethyella okanaganae]|uniref:TetR/AcrR family transcriptional regulator n=1 Tax=Luethyella okanaganae TaxID=69372 RepID=A0ABW1VGA4_9MICO